MKIKRIITLSALTLVLAACDPIKPERTEVASSGVTVNLIVQVEGCNVYGIDRGGASRWIYTTICPAEGGKTASTAYRQNCGKNCDRNVEVPTTRLGGEVEKKYQERLTND